MRKAVTTHSETAKRDSHPKAEHYTRFYSLQICNRQPKLPCWLQSFVIWSAPDFERGISSYMYLCCLFIAAYPAYGDVACLTTVFCIGCMRLQTVSPDLQQWPAWVLSNRALARKVMQSAPPVCLSARLFLLYLLNWLTFDLLIE